MLEGGHCGAGEGRRAGIGADSRAWVLGVAGSGLAFAMMSASHAGLTKWAQARRAVAARRLGASLGVMKWVVSAWRDGVRWMPAGA